MLCGLHDLDRRIVANVDADVGRKRHLRETKLAAILFVRRAVDLEDGNHDMAHVQGLRPQTQVDVHERGRVAGEPAWLYANCSAADRPFGSVCAGWQTAAWRARQT